MYIVSVCFIFLHVYSVIIRRERFLNLKTKQLKTFDLYAFREHLICTNCTQAELILACILLIHL